MDRSLVEVDVHGTGTFRRVCSDRSIYRMCASGKYHSHETKVLLHFPVHCNIRSGTNTESMPDPPIRKVV